MPSARTNRPGSTLGHSDAAPRKLGVDDSGSHLDIEIRGGQEDPTEDGEEKVPFFGSRHDRKEKRWVVSLAVALKLVVFVVAMFVNDCPRKSHGDCLFRSLSRFSFQPLRENPLLGPSPSTLDALGALRRVKIIAEKQKWRLMTFTWLHGGVFHLVINISSILFIGIRLVKYCGPWRTMIIYLLSAFAGSLLSALFVQNSPVVGASSPLFGLLGAMLSGLIQNWSRYDDKLPALLMMSFIAMISFILGLLPYTDNFANMGSLISGILLGAMSTFDPKSREVNRKKEPRSYGHKVLPASLIKFGSPLTRIIAMILFVPFLIGLLLAVFKEVDANKYCTWCHNLNCVSVKKWSCSENDMPCQTTVSSARLTLTCQTNGKFRIFPYADMSMKRLKDLCNEICS